MRRLSFAVLVVFAACTKQEGAQKPTPAPKAVTLEAACDDYQAIVCEKLDECSHFQLVASEGDMGRCRARGKLRCLHELAPPGSGVTPEWLDRCAKAQRIAMCTAFFDRVPECVPPSGKLTVGVPCSSDAQCTTLFCARDATDSCGRCANAPTDGEACGKQGCGVGKSCIGGACVTPARAGGSCTGKGRCFGFLSCTDGQCSAPAKVGESCDPAGKGAPECDFGAGVVCDPSAKVCKLAKVAITSMATCGDLNVCGGALRCGAAKQCLPPIPDGGECEVDKGQFCDPPARCVDERCKLPDHGACK
jgi:hypothetical protein